MKKAQTKKLLRNEVGEKKAERKGTKGGGFYMPSAYQDISSMSEIQINIRCNNLTEIFFNLALLLMKPIYRRLKIRFRIQMHLY